ncbi:MAG: AEC family transporter [Promethearchaeota archaeon]|nr:MAG: AEC family transporter [Candidatus Lokiarchaeota archaeon]
MTDVNYIFLLSLTIIVIGYILKKLNIISEENGKTIAKVVFNVTLPALILNVIISIKITPSLGLITLISILYCIPILVLAFTLFRNYPKEIKGLIFMAVIGFNVGHFAYPLIEGIWNEEGLKYIAMFDIGNAMVIFVICYILGLIYSPNNEFQDKKELAKNILFKLLKSAPLMSYIIAIILNFLNIGFPIFVLDLLDVLSRANMALTLLLLGIFLNFKYEKSQWKNAFIVLIIRYSFGLVIGLMLFFLLPFDQLYRGILAIALILPIGLAIIPFTVEFEYNERFAGMVANLTIIISFVLLWVVIILLGFG